ncbi:MAG: hypothetical protein WD845_12050 [Pirellulales bacterium]
MRLRLLIPIATMLAVLSQAFRDAPLAVAQQAEPAVTATRQHAFIIPFRIEPARSPQEQPVEVQLHVSSDQGVTWSIAETVKPDKGQFVFRAAHDGEYWYAIRTVDGQGLARPQGQLQAQLKVVVDTVAPRLELTALRGAAGEIMVHWQAVDPHLKPDTLKLEYQNGPADPWESVAVNAPPSAMRHTSSGDATWWPKSANGTINIRAAITDTAGNPALSQAVVATGATETAGGSGASPGNVPDASNPLGPGASAQRRPPNATADGASAWSGASRGPSPAEAARPTPTQPRVRPASQVTRDPSKPSPLDFNILPVGERPRMVASRMFELEYEIDQIGPSGVAKVELWGTLDGGRTWTLYGRDVDNLSPLEVRVEKEGIYGFRIVVQSGSGMGGQPPTAGDVADVWIGVDLANPQGRITAAEVNDDGSELVTTWEISDDALDVRPVTLEFAPSAEGPWTPIASGLENSGSYTWQVESRVPPVIQLRMAVRDEAGNTGVFDWSKPVVLDRSKPAGRIRDVRALDR